ncbi:MAG: hypothetical protein L6Q55_07725 [Azonexus sp.]|nr:hypothetical protein [Azonexus sp.]MCK6412298.1 hypothetical protein [Azonexus sp.]
MPTPPLWAGVLSQLLIHDETGCPHSARHAIRLLDCLSEDKDIDTVTRELCERASRRLETRLDPRIVAACRMDEKLIFPRSTVEIGELR